LSEQEAERNRRSIYIFVRRNTRYPLFESFDMPDTHESCARRNVTTSPVQALHLLNGEPSLKWAKYFAARVLISGAETREAQVATAFHLAFSRPPTRSEIKTVAEFLDRQEEILQTRHRAGEEIALPPGDLGRTAIPRAAALVDLCHALINANEFVYRN
jgi:hypothetical protein